MKRIEYIDIFKGIGIILMVIGHLHFSENAEHFIYAFHMLLFYIGIFIQIRKYPPLRFYAAK